MAVPANADTVHLYSGASTEGTYDDNIHMLTGPIDGPLTNDFTDAATFAAAINGPSAYVVTPNEQWVQQIGGDGGGGIFEASLRTSDLLSPARWISSDPNGAQGGSFTALYALDFTLPEFTDASLHLEFSADQTLGTTADNGVFLNGTALTGSGGGNYSQVLTFDFLDVSSLLHSGTNILYLYNVNYGGPSGVMFDATFSYTPAPVPEPTTATLFGLSALGGLILSRRCS